MPQSDNQRLKLLYLAKIFTEQTDDAHGLSLKQIAAELGRYDITADRKTLYSDIENLRRFGMDIITEQKGRDLLYHLADREFELPELKLLVDSVQSAKFLTVRKSNELIRKIESLGSRYDAQYLQRQVWISDRVKSMNERVYYSVDRLHDAINLKKQVRFHYYRWNVRKETELRKGGAWYVVSPWGLVWDNENYYLVAYDSEDERIKHYRVDKMLDLRITDDDRVGGRQYREFNLPKYSKSLFGMFGGEPVTVTLEGRNDLVGVVIDRFGKDTHIRKKDDEHFLAEIQVTVSRQFLGWVFAIGEGLKIAAPESVVGQMREEVRRLQREYAENGKNADGTE
ncbi:MAG: WYL domain-containing protein [Clostridia bacterium]|nr:WYL domain-containing protein [Clostridia bacterium]MBR0445397.1 WYL domain-containing protein [Clostridia bacterium]